MEIFNRGDTACILLNYEVNGSPLTEGAYQELEFQINPQMYFNSVKKLLSKGEIVWDTVEYEEDGQTETFTGYVCYLTQEDSFKIGTGTSKCQLRVLMNSEVGSSEQTEITLGNVLSKEII